MVDFHKALVTRKLVLAKKKLMPVKRVFKPYCFETDGVTQGLLSSFVNCRQLCWYILNNWQPVAAKDALIFGDLMHYLLEQLCAGRLIDFNELLAEWGTLRGKPTSGDQQTEIVAATAEALLQNYANYWSKKDKAKKWVKAEALFDVRLEGTRLRGKRDALFEEKGKLWILETKTKSRIDEEALSLTLDFDFQSLFYVMTTEVELQRPVAGVLYNIIGKPQIRLGKKETTGAFMQRIREDVAGRPAQYFRRLECVYSPARRENFLKELQMRIDDFKAWVFSGYKTTYKNENACTGRWACEYLSACAQQGFAGFARTKELFGELK